MRPLAVPLLLLPWALAAHAEPLPGFLDSHEYERRLPGANLPIDAYRPVSAHLQLAGEDGDSPRGRLRIPGWCCIKCASKAARCSP